MNTIQAITISAIPIIFAITLHEAAHGYAARYFGDQTAFWAGRISLNPFVHIDLFGTIILPAVLYWSTNGAFLFGYAKPVPVNFGRLRDPKKNMLWVAGAGPAANLFMALAWGLLQKVAEILPLNDFTLPLRLTADVGITINLILMVLNLVPIPPLDGGRIAVSVLPISASRKLASLERWGIFIILFLLFTHILDQFISPAVVFLRFLLANLFHLNY